MGKARKKRIDFKRWIPLYIMGIPGLLYLFINNYMPLYGLLIAFKRFDYSKGVFGSPWAGLKNFEFLFQSDSAWVITRNTILYNLVFMVLNMAISIFLAILLNEVKSKAGKKFYQTMILLPYLMSMVIISYLVYAFLGDRTGLINGILRGMGQDPISFYATEKYWPFILIFVNAWRGAGYGAVVYLASIVGFDNAYYEAAELDGASKWQQITQITIPLLKPTIIIMLTMSMGMVFRSDFGLFYQVPRNQGVLYDVTDTIDTFVYRALMQNGNLGLSSAAAFFQSIVCFITIMLFNGLVRKVSEEQALF